VPDEIPIQTSTAGAMFSPRSNVAPMRRLNSALTDNTASLPGLTEADSVDAPGKLEDWETNGEVCTDNGGMLKQLSGFGVGTDNQTFDVLIMGRCEMIGPAPGLVGRHVSYTEIPILKVRFTLGDKTGAAGGIVNGDEVYARKVEVLEDYIAGQYTIWPGAASATSGGPARLIFDPGTCHHIQYRVSCVTAAEAGLLEADITRF